MHAELLTQFPGEGAEFRLTRLYNPTGKIPHVRIRTLVRAPVHEEDAPFIDQRTQHDALHEQIQAPAADGRALLGFDPVEFGVRFFAALGNDGACVHDA